MTKQRTNPELEMKIVTEMAKLSKDPYTWVLFSFPWGEGELEGQEPEAWQVEILKAIRDGLLTVDQAIKVAVASGHGIGKAMSLETTIPTPQGNKRWGDLIPGDVVFGVDGKPTRIIQTKHYNNAPMFRVSFDDGSYCDVSSGHLWNVRGRQERRKGVDTWRTLETIELLELGVKRPNGEKQARQWEIPVQGAVEFEEKEIDLHPYLLGVWLGDGHKGGPRYTKPNLEIADKIRGLGYEVVTGADMVTHYIHNISHLFVDGVFNCSSHERYIPEEYKYNTAANRMALLQGLCDTDGEVHNSGSIGYSTTSKRLAEDVVWLARSLGCKAMLQPKAKSGYYLDEKGERVICRDCYRITINSPFNPFTVNHRKSAYKPSEKRYLTRWIDSIEPISEAECMCISVEAIDGLYQANDFIVTHNSALVAWIILWSLSTFPDTRGVVTANTDTQLRTKTWPELATWYRRFICKHWFNLTATAIYSVQPEHEKTWRFDLVPWSENNTEAFAGLHNKGKRIVLIFDEASAIADKVWEVSEGALTDADTQILWCAFGNPTRNSGRFRECWGKFRHRWVTKQVDSRSVKISNKKQIDEWITDYGIDSDFVKVRVLGVFPSGSVNQLISRDLADKAASRKITRHDYYYAPVVLGTDVAWEGDDSSCVFERQGLAAMLKGLWHGIDNMTLGGMVDQFWREDKADGVFVDLGWGSGVIDYLRSIGRNPIPVNFGGRALKAEYADKRTEMWCEMKKWLEDGGVIPNDPRLIDDLTGPEIYFLPNGKKKLESKKDMKARGLASPDSADALCLTFAAPVAKARPEDEYRTADENKVETEYAVI